MEIPNFDKIWLFTAKEVFRFSVQACSEANIFLAQTPYYKDVGAQIKIGTNNNEKTTIIPDVSNTGHSESVATPRILDCDVMREFWISWDRNKVSVGKGQPSENEILSTSHTIDDVKAFSISTVEGVQGFWEIDKKEGMEFQ